MSDCYFGFILNQILARLDVVIRTMFPQEDLHAQSQYGNFSKSSHSTHYRTIDLPSSFLWFQILLSRGL